MGINEMSLRVYAYVFNHSLPTFDSCVALGKLQILKCQQGLYVAPNTLLLNKIS